MLSPHAPGDVRLSVRVKLPQRGAVAGDDITVARNRFFRAHPVLVACVTALRAAVPEELQVVRFYETRSEERSRG